MTVKPERGRTARLDQELEKRLEEKYKLMFMKEHNGAILQEAREKWFNSPDSRSGQCARNSIMANAFGHPFYSWQVWDNVRKLTCQHGGFAAVQPPKAAT